jgi:PAS domain S-box-containing protein
MEKKAQTLHALQASEIRYRRLFETAQDGILILNAETGEIDDVNPYMIDMLHYSREKFLGRKLWEVSPFKDKIFNKVAFEELQEKGYIRYKDLPLETKEGKPVAVEFVSNVYQANGNKVIQCNIRNITDRKRAEEMVAENERKFSTLIGNLPGMAYRCDNDREWTMSFLSEGCRNLTGYAPEEIIGKRLLSYNDLISFEHRERVWNEVQTALSKREHYSFEYSITTAAGDVKWVWERGCGIFSPDGEVQALEGFISDITERKLADERLQDSEELYRLVVENAKEAIIITQDEKVVFANSAATGMVGFSEEIFTSKSFTDLIHPDDLNMVVDHHIRRIKGEEVPPVYPFRVIAKNGTVIWCELNAAIIQWKGTPATLVFLTNITERKRADEELKESEKKYRLLAENIQDVVFVFDMNLNYTYISPSVKLLRGYEPEEVLKQQSIEKTLTPSSQALALKTLSEIMELEKSGRREEIPISRTLQLEMIRKDGTTLWTDVKFSLIRDENQELVSIMGVTRDITERKLAEEALQERERYFKAVTENSSDITIIVDKKGSIKYCSRSIERIAGYKPDELIGRNVNKFIHPDDKKRALDDFSKAVLSKDSAIPNEFRIVHKDGSKHYVDGLGKNLLDDPIIAGFIINVHDVTDRKRAYESLCKSENQLSNAVNIAHLGPWEYDVENDIFTFNDYFYDIFRTTAEQVGGYTMSSADYAKRFVHPDDAALVGEQVRKCIETDDPNFSIQLEHRIIYRNGEIGYITVRIFIAKDEKGRTVRTYGVNQDITERKQAEEELKESEKRYRLLADNVDDVIFVLDMNLNYTYASPSVKVLMGYEPEELLNLGISETMTPISCDLATKKLSKEIETSEEGGISELQVLQLEMKRKDKSTVWTELKASFIRDENRRPVGIIGVSRDITERRKAEVELQQTLESLRKSIGATIQTMVAAIEMRDPYTAGHQLRVADLARTIATEMGLAPDKIEGIRMAGSIHDIGKLSIPAEILSKPTKLTNLEFSLIKEHSKNGYEMLKNVESPWPLAQIVYQHHERMDGSGYPRNLKGDEILMEARIMAVADVVEAMASHRPYRPGLGIDAALAEIEKNKGTHYDNTVADTCLKLFREKGYQLT